MKYLKHFALLLLVSAISLYGCKDEAKTTATPSQPEPQPIDFSNTPSQQNNSSTTANTGQNSSGVYHYTCSNGCAGGSAAAGNCATCGNALAHNQAFHASNNNNNASNPFNTPQAEPAQNAAGVYHYTCSNGCAGGAASAGNCSSCGNALAHNSAYHQ